MAEQQDQITGKFVFHTAHRAGHSGVGETLTTAIVLRAEIADTFHPHCPLAPFYFVQDDVHLTNRSSAACGA